MPKKRKSLPDVELLRSLLAYDPVTGSLTWRATGINAYRLASTRSGRYFRVCMLKTSFLAHRIIWKVMTGNDPDVLVDHKDRNGQNNRWENLRAANDAENVRNAKLSSANTSGIKGVTFDKQTQRWLAQIVVNYRNIKVGRFDSLDDAAAAVAAKRLEVHGQFARSE